MQGHESTQPQLLDVSALAGQLLVPGTVHAFIAEHRTTLFPGCSMEVLFPSTRGRPSLQGPMIGTVMVLQVFECLSDWQAAEALTFDLRWKAACWYGLTEQAFHPTTLTYWRKRLTASAHPHRVRDAVFSFVAETGILTGKHRRALESTVMDDAVARQHTTTQLIVAIRRFGKHLPDGTSLLAAHAIGHDYSRPGKPETAWDDKDAKDQLVSALITDALSLLAAVDPEQLDGHAADTYALLALVAGQEAEPADGFDGTDGRWKIARKVAKDRVVSVGDPESRHSRKSQSVLKDRYKAHIGS